MKTLQILACLLAALGAQSLVSQGAPVNVRGYYTKNGTYVAPHTRSGPDSSKPSNSRSSAKPTFSTAPAPAAPISGTPPSLGETLDPAASVPAPVEMPFTPTPRFLPPEIDSDSTLAKPRQAVPFNKEEYLARKKERVATLLEEEGILVDTHRYSWEELNDIFLRVQKSIELKALGYQYSWDSLTLDEFDQKLLRHQKIQDLEAKGIHIDSATIDLAGLIDIENRIKEAARLQLLGIRVDWQKYSLSQLTRKERDYYALHH